jgi:transcription elongation factor Elf1
MTDYIDVKYANLLSPKLPLFKWTDKDTANFRCPLCGDSKRSKIKKRGCFYSSKNRLNFKCHNCGASMSFDFFLKTVDYNLHKEYSLEKYKYNNEHRWFNHNVKKADSRINSELKTEKNNPLDHLISIQDLPIEHNAKQYIIQRKIPEQYWTKLFYAENYLKWINEYIEIGRFQKLPVSDKRIVIPFYSGRNIPFAYIGRALYDCDQKYLSINPNKNNMLIYGLDTVDSNKLIHVVEGPLDSMFLPNSVAVSGSALSKLFKYKQFDFIFIYDNQPRNAEVCKCIERAIKADKKVVIWPNNLEFKDINEMILGGLSQEKILDIMYNNCYSGLNAELRFNEWKRV